MDVRCRSVELNYRTIAQDIRRQWHKIHILSAFFIHFYSIICAIHCAFGLVLFFCVKHVFIA